MASIILLPVVYAILNGRGESFGSVSLASALVPGINLEFLLYDAYSVGLLGITFLAIIYCIVSIGVRGKIPAKDDYLRRQSILLLILVLVLKHCCHQLRRMVNT